MDQVIDIASLARKLVELSNGICVELGQDVFTIIEGEVVMTEVIGFNESEVFVFSNEKGDVVGVKEWMVYPVYDHRLPALLAWAEDQYVHSCWNHNRKIDKTMCQAILNGDTAEVVRCI